MPAAVEPAAVVQFIVEIDGVPLDGIVAVSGLDLAIEVIEYRDGSGQGTRKLPGQVNYPNVVLRFAVGNDRVLSDWQRSWAAADPAAQRKAVAVRLLDRAGRAVREWKLRNAWPAKWTGPVLDAAAAQVPLQTLELAHEGIDWA
jgi:phage tail-like protein